MKKFLVLFFSIFICSIAHADTETINWYVDGTSYATTTCQTGGDIILPNTPYKYGYTFQGWADYTPIEYIESTGTQWIDTGVKQQHIFYFIEASKSNTADQSLLGIAASLTDYSNNKEFQIGITTGLRPFIVYSSGLVSNASIATNKKYKYSGHVGMVSTLTIEDTNTNIISSISKTVNQELNFITNFFLLRRAVAQGTNNWSGRLYSCKIYDENNNLIRDFIPVIDFNGIPCMYDKVTDQYFYNQGTGQFTPGNPI